MKYRDIVIEAFDAKVTRIPTRETVEAMWQRSFKVRVLRSPAGEMTPEDAVICTCDERGLQKPLQELGKRTISRERLIELGRLLGMLLLPASTKEDGSSVRELFKRSLDNVGPDGGLRVRLQLPALLSAMPWEYLYLDRTGSGVGTMLGFLALDPRISIVRHESLPLKPLEPAVPGDINVLAVLASPPDQEMLDLEREHEVLRVALADKSAFIKPDVRMHATLNDLRDGLPGKQIFHFAGHGLFEQRPGEKPGSTTGTGMIALDDQTVDAEQLAIALRGNEIRLAVLGGCETGRLAGAHGWEGVVSALVRAEIPAVVANQLTILDTNAIAFTRAFYQGLAGGLSIESAVQAGRIEAYNADVDGRDWGVPVLYLRAETGALFAGAQDASARTEACKSVEIRLKQRVGEVAVGGVLVGAKLRELISTNVRVEMKITEPVFGRVTGVLADTARSGAIESDQIIEAIAPGGSVVGVAIGNMHAGDNAAMPPPGNTDTPKPRVSNLAANQNLLDFTQIVTERTWNFTGRQWVFDEVEKWRARSRAQLSPASRMFVLTGGPGTGKTAIAARLVQMHLERLQSAAPSDPGSGSLSYFHFCQAGLDSTLSPTTFSRSLAEALANRYPEYRESLQGTRSQQFSITANVAAGKVETGAAVTGVSVYIEVLGVNARILFDLIVRQPLRDLCSRRPNERILILVDSLDEARTFNSESNIIQLLRTAGDFPSQVQFLVTCRSNDTALDGLRDVFGLDLIVDAPASSDDVESYAKVRLCAVLEPQRSRAAVRVARRSDGNFLYAFHVLNDLTRDGADLSALDEADLPVGLEGVYRNFLQRQLLADEKEWSKAYRPVLGVIAVARGEGLTRRQIIGATRLPDDVAGDVLSASGQYLVGGKEDQPYHIYHQSFRDFLLEDAKFSVVPAERHASIAGYMEERYADDWGGCTDSYALRHTPYHWAEAAKLSENQREERTKSLIGLVLDPGYRRAFERDGGDLPAIQEDLQRAVRTAVLNQRPRMLPSVIKAAKALADFDRDYLQGEALVALADRGEIEKAEARLRLFPDLQKDWQTAARLILAWLATANNPLGAKNLADRLGQMVLADGTTLRLRNLLGEVLGGAPRLPFTRLSPPPIEMGKALVQRISGQPFDRELLFQQVNPSLLVGARQAPGMGADEDSRYAASDDAPMLVAIALAFPQEGTALMDQYIDAHAGYNYVEYRNRSLWFVLGAVLSFHPEEPWVKARLRRILVAALTGGGAVYREQLPLTAAVLWARWTSNAQTALAYFRTPVLQKAAELRNSRGSDDIWGSHKRRLVSLMEISALVADDNAGAEVLMHRIDELPGGFAGFQAPAFLRLADAARASGAGFPGSRDRALEMAERVAHNIQDYHFCARITARCNALKRWHARGLAGEKLVGEVRRLAAWLTLREFPAVHVVGEGFLYRKDGGQGVLSVEEARCANSLELLAEVFQRPIVDFQHLNPGLPSSSPLLAGTEVKIPDPGLAPLLAVHLSACTLGDPSLGSRRPELIRSLIPTASANPTALDTVLSYLVIAVQPNQQDLLREIALEAGEVSFSDLGVPLGQIGPHAPVMA